MVDAQYRALAEAAYRAVYGHEDPRLEESVITLVGQQIERDLRLAGFMLVEAPKSPSENDEIALDTPMAGEG